MVTYGWWVFNMQNNAVSPGTGWGTGRQEGTVDSQTSSRLKRHGLSHAIKETQPGEVHS